MSKNVFTVNYNHIAKLTFGLSLLLIFSNCSSNDDFDSLERTSIPLFTEADLSVIHGDSEKSWKITEIINVYSDPSYNSKINIHCMKDDLYTFFAGIEDITIGLGENSCFQSSNNNTATDIFEGKITFRDGTRGKTIILNFTQGSKIEEQDQTTTRLDGTYYALSELTEDRMVFQGETEQFLGEYRQALIFEKI